jgi:3-methylcrotonyl-CoA carboxylase alpha subunit
MRLLCGEEAFDVDVRQATDGPRVTVNGAAVDLRVETAGLPGAFVVEQGDRRIWFHCVRDGDVLHLFWQGRVYRLTEETETSRASHRVTGGGLDAPMPGKVIEVKVAAGDTVSKGDELLVVEAMKMENAVRAPRDGRVKTVSARVGEMVSPGTILVELE